MMSSLGRVLGIALGVIMLAGCISLTNPSQNAPAPVVLKLTMLPHEQVAVVYTTRTPVDALHFAQELGGYRQQAWHAADPAFRWITEGNGERVERADGKAFDQVEFVIPIDYQHLPKSYAPFSPFSEGSTLIYSGQFHSCLSAPCDGTDALPISIIAKGKVIGLEGRRVADRAKFVSDKDGTNIFIGTLELVDTDGFNAIIDPGLPNNLREHLDLSLPRAIRDFGAIYGPLSFRPELYVSIDARPEPTGHESTQGGTLPNQIFMHFDGEHARERLAKDNPYWLDWFFAHEAAHLFQQDKVGELVGNDQEAWIHEGGADAMAALVLLDRGKAERAYVEKRERESETACANGLANTPLGRATAEGKFDLHYQCGLLIWLALDSEISRAGHEGLGDLNRAFFAKVSAGQSWSGQTLLVTARDLGASPEFLSRISRFTANNSGDAVNEIEAIGGLARQSLANHIDE